MDPRNLFIKDYTYPLSADQIADFPLERRDHSRLLVYRDRKIGDDYFFNLVTHLPKRSVIVLNNTRVIEARVLFKKATGGVIELFCLEPGKQQIKDALAQTGKVTWNCLIGGASKWKPGLVLQKKLGEEGMLEARYVGKSGDSFLIEFSWSPGHLYFSDVLHQVGATPLPPYIKRVAETTDTERYQTVFNREQGSVAAPTAALHFTDHLLESLKKQHDVAYLTLHVGAGTFQPVKSEQIGDHGMHSEPFSVSRQLVKQVMDADTVIPVGTTSLRTLESLHWLGVKLIKEGRIEQWTLGQWEAYELVKNNVARKESFGALLRYMEKGNLEELWCRTSLLIAPSYTFNVPSGLITNFHQPQSTLLLLIAAFVGEDWKKIYSHALQEKYRFLSYGDSSLLIP
jgi:S-adenosylmethionine:tRNA ribosyltransferase-isomerase